MEDRGPALSTVQTREGPIRIFWSNTGNPQLWDLAAPADPVYFRENGISWDGLRWADDPVPVRTRLLEVVRAGGSNEVDTAPSQARRSPRTSRTRGSPSTRPRSTWTPSGWTTPA